MIRAPGSVDAPVVKSRDGGPVTELVVRDGPSQVGGGGGVGVADPHLKSLGEAAPRNVQIMRLLVNEWELEREKN